MRFVFSFLLVLTLTAASANHGEDTPPTSQPDEHAVDDKGTLPRRFGVPRAKNPPDETALTNDMAPIQIKLGQLGDSRVVPDEEENYQAWPQYQDGIPDNCKNQKDVVCCSVAAFYPPKNPPVELPFGKVLPITKVRTKIDESVTDQQKSLGLYRLEAKLNFKLDGTKSVFVRCETYSDKKRDLTVGDLRKAYGLLVVVEPKP